MSSRCVALRWRMRTQQRAGLLAALLAVLVFLPARQTWAQRSSETYQRFGLVEAHDAPEFADDLRAGWERARFHWAYIQPNGPDEWLDAELTDEELERERSAGREVIGLLIGIPDWARDEQGLPRGLYLSPGDPDNLWANFVREAVTRYRGRIDHWIIWNEPDVWDTEHPGYTWAGDVGDYVQLLKIAYLVAHEVNPDSAIHLAAVTHWWDVLYDRELYFRRIMEALQEEPDAPLHDYYYDVATLHLYFNPGSVYEVIEQYDAIQAEYGLDKPIWLVETNAAPSSDPGWNVAEPTFQVSLLEQAAYMPQAIALATAAGADRIAVYKLVDTPGDYAANPEPFGLVRADRSTRPAYQTTRVAMEMLAEVDRADWVDRHLVAQVIAQTRHHDRLVRILWSRVPFAQTVQVPAAAVSGILVDMWGNVSAIDARGGSYSIALMAGECQQTTGDYCMIGGPPVYLVETIPEGSPVQLEDLSVTASPLENVTSAANGTEARRGLAMWLGLSGGILVLAAAAVAARLQALRAP